MLNATTMNVTENQTKESMVSSVQEGMQNKDTVPPEAAQHDINAAVEAEEGNGNSYKPNHNFSVSPGACHINGVDILSNMEISSNPIVEHKERSEGVKVQDPLLDKEHQLAMGKQLDTVLASLLLKPGPRKLSLPLSFFFFFFFFFFFLSFFLSFFLFPFSLWRLGSRFPPTTACNPLLQG
jgi:hypothetical protein